MEDNEKTFEEWYAGIEWWTKIGPDKESKTFRMIRDLRSEHTKEQKLEWFKLYRSLYGHST